MNNSIAFLVLITIATGHCDFQISKSSKEVFGFTHFVPESIYKNYDLEKITALVFLDDHIDQDFLDYAAENQVRTYLTGSYPASKLGDYDYRDKWTKNILTLLRIHKINGLHFSFNAPIRRGDPQRDQLTDLVRYLKEQLFNQYSELSVSVPWSPINKHDTATNGQDYDYVQIIKEADFVLINSFHVNAQIFVNTSEYDDEVCLAKSNQGFIEAAAGLLGWLSINETHSAKKFNHDEITDYVVNELLINDEQDLRNKIILVFPWFGLDYTCLQRVERQRCLISSIGYFDANCSDKVAKEVKFSDIMRKLLDDKLVLLYDPHSRSTYLEFKDETSSVHQLWFDYTYDYVLKYKYVKQFKLRGMGIMSLDFLDYQDEKQKSINTNMWQTIPKLS